MKINTENAPKPVGLYPHARRVGGLLFLSGVGPRVAGSDANDSVVPGLTLDKNGNYLEFDFESQLYLISGTFEISDRIKSSISAISYLLICYIIIIYL